MRRTIHLVLILILASSCSQSRYGHLTVRAKHTVNKSDRTQTAKQVIEAQPSLQTSTDVLLSIPEHFPDVDPRMDAIAIEQQAVDRPQVMTSIEQEASMEMDVVATFKPTHSREIHQPERTNSFFKSLMRFLSIVIVVALFIAFLAWIGSLFGIPFWTGVQWLAIAFAVITVLGWLGLLEFWMGS